jgi:CHAT domain-containing protein/tetratricopeptide (TPR) repeat protein
MVPTLTQMVDDILQTAEPPDHDIGACLEAARTSAVTDPDQTSTVLSNLDRLGIHLFQTGRSAQGRSSFKLAYDKALESVSRGVETGPTCQLARRLRSLGWTQAALGLLDEAVRSTCTERDPEEAGAAAVRPPRHAEFRNSLGNLLRETGQLGDAEEMLKLALNSIPQPEHRKRFLELREAVLNNLGLVYEGKRDPKRAIEVLIESIRIQDELSSTGTALAITLDNLGCAYVSLGRRQGPLELGDGYVNEAVTHTLRLAADCFSRAESVFRATLPDGVEDFVICLINALDLALYSGDMEEGGRIVEDAKRVIANTGFDNPETIWSLTDKEVKLLRRQGREADAIALARQLLDTVPSSDLPPNDDLANLMESLASMSAARGLGEEVWRAAKVASAIDDILLNTILPGSSETQSFNMSERVMSRTECLLGACISVCTGGDGFEWLYALLLRRKGILSERMGSAWLEARSSVNETVVALSREVHRLRAEAARIDLDGGNVTSITKARRLQSEAARRVDDAEASLFRMIERDREANPAVTPQEVCDALPANTVLVEFARAWTPNGGPRYFAFDLRDDRTLVLRDVGSVDDVDAQIQSFTTSVSMSSARAGKADSRTSGQDANEAGRALAARLLGPQNKLPHNVLVAPVGLIATLPFAALPDEKDSERELIGDHAFSFIPNSRWLVNNAEKSNAPMERPVVIGNPDFDKGFDEDLPFSVSWRQPPLSAAEQEARVVAELLGVSPIVGAPATRERVLATRSPQILHIATHGVFLSAIRSLAEAAEPRASTIRQVGGIPIEEELDSDSVIGSDSRGDPNLTAEHLQRQQSKARATWLGKIGPSDRQSRSVLLLAGVNAWMSGAATPEDVGSGMISASEFALLDLNGTELVVLSGCETAAGAIDYVDGTVLGLRRSALLAGARASISTLWQIDDQATSAIMSSFYRRLIAGNGRSEALRQAQLEVRSRVHQPHLWAALILEGDPGRLVGP